jgi:hypothetical protein
MARCRRIRGERVKIWLSRETVKTLKSLKIRNENYDSVVRRLLENYKKIVGY